MKKQFFVYVFLICNVVVYAESLLVAVLMVKNEEQAMEMTLQPLIDAGISKFMIYDTGSTDNTIQVTWQLFDKNNIVDGIIIQEDWIDFASSRNRALELTEQYFSDVEFMLMLDAEWILHCGDQLLQFCMQHRNDSICLYSVKFTSGSITFYHPRLIRAGSGIHFVGKVHEKPNVDAQGKVDDQIYFQLRSTHYGQEKSRQRWNCDIQILLQELQEKPNDGRTLYFLAQTYSILGETDLAIDYYQKRLQIQDYNEELFLSYCFLAELYKQKNMIESMITTCLQAFALFDHRAEPLIYLAQYYYSIGAYQLCYIFARFACTMTYPTKDVSLIDTHLYRVVRYALVSAMAHMFGDYRLGFQATQKVLQAYPDNQYLQEQLASYQAYVV